MTGARYKVEDGADDQGRTGKEGRKEGRKEGGIVGEETADIHRRHTCSNKAATRSLSYIHPKACRRACRSPRLLKPIILSTYLRTALARIRVVLMRPWRMAAGRKRRKGGRGRKRKDG